MVPRSFSLHDLNDPAKLLADAEALALVVTDKPGLPLRSLEEKQESCIFGLAPEIWYEQHGALRRHKFADVLFEGKKIEVKTIREASLSQALDAMKFSRSASADVYHIWVANRDTSVFTFFGEFDWRTRRRVPH